MLGQVVTARGHLEQALALYDPQQHGALAFRYGQDPGASCLSYMAWALWVLGYPDQARQQSHAALTLAQELSHANSLAHTLVHAAILRQLCRETQWTQAQAEAAVTLSTKQRIPQWLALATILRGWALTVQGQGEEVTAQVHQGIAAYRATGAGIYGSYCLALMAETYGAAGQPEAGLVVLTEAMDVVHTHAEHFYEAELHRLKGELLLQSRVRSRESDVSTPDSGLRPPDSEAETCFHQALDVAHHQQAKSLELRAAMSLSRLWQHQGKRAEARQLLVEVYGWFTEGFDTADLQEAKALLEELG
jgi:predicted ATPase